MRASTLVSFGGLPVCRCSGFEVFALPIGAAGEAVGAAGAPTGRRGLALVLGVKPSRPLRISLIDTALLSAMTVVNDFGHIR